MVGSLRPSLPTIEESESILFIIMLVALVFKVSFSDSRHFTLCNKALFCESILFTIMYNQSTFVFKVSFSESRHST